MEESLPSIRKSVLLLVLGFAFGIFGAILYSLSSIIFTPGVDVQNVNLMVAMLLGEILIPVPMIIWIIKNKYDMKRLLRLNSVKSGLWLPAIISSLGILILLDEFDRLISIFFSMPENQMANIEALMQIEDLMSAIMVIGIVVIIGPFIEELVFRGFFQGVLEKRINKVKYSIMISAACFALLHFNIWWLIQIYIIGIFLAYFAFYSNSIFLPFLLHMLNNGLSVLLAQFPDTKFDWYIWKGHINPFILIIAIVALFYGMNQIKSRSEIGMNLDKR